MASFKKFLQSRSGEEGMSLVEVVVAMMVFAIISVGVVASLGIITRITADVRASQVATSLATTDLDLQRGLDPFAILNDDYPVVVGDITYTVTRSTSWVETSGADVGCGTGTGTMQAKRVNVTVTWAGKLPGTPDVRSDTLISPEGRINDPNLGTIRVSALDAGGSGSADVAVTISVVTAGKVLAAQPANTDSDGCSYALKVFPGTYKVSISRAGSIDSNQVASPFKNVTVTAGGSVAAQFQYDYAARFNLMYANNYTGSAPKFPTNLDTTYLSTYAPYVDGGGRKIQVSLHPFSSGYSGIAGKFVAKSESSAGCLSVDPANWQEATVNNVSLAAGVRTPPVAGDVTGPVTMNIPMGVAAVNQSGTYTLTAESAAAPASAADPGCGVGMSYTFGSVTGNQTIALPYGSWTLYATTALGKLPISSGNVGLLSSALGLLSGTGNVITLDPRVAK